MVGHFAAFRSDVISIAEITGLQPEASASLAELLQRLTKHQDHGIAMTVIPGPAAKPANFSHSPNFPALLAELRSSLLVTTYQAGQLCSFGTRERFSLLLTPRVR